MPHDPHGDPTAVPNYRSLLDLSGRAVVVLGAGQGIGRQCAHALTQAGAAVVCVDRVDELAKSVADEVGGHAVVGDIISRTEVERIIAAAEASAGPLTGLVDVVGVAYPGDFVNYDDDRWDRQFDIVLEHTRLAMQVGGRAILRAGGGSMVFIGSSSGEGYAKGQAVYGTAKAALHHLVRSVGVEWAAEGVRVNAVAPGPVRTPRLVAAVDEAGWESVSGIIPRGYAGVPSEIASAVLFLMSDLANYVTGHVLMADGGIVNRMPAPAIEFAAEASR